MNEVETMDLKIHGRLTRALTAWVCQGNEQPLTRWLDRELDSEGVPFRLAIPQWHECLRVLAAARRQGRDWPVTWDEPVTRLIQTTLRFSRPDGSAATDFTSSSRERATGSESREAKRERSTEADGRSMSGWLSQRKDEHPPGALAAWASTDRVLAVLRADGRATADFLAIDHRNARSDCQFELFGAGRSWLGPSWRIAGEAGTSTMRPRPRAWISTSAAALVEWSSRAGALRLTQSTVLLRARRLALLAVLLEKNATLSQSLEARVSVPATITAVPDQNSRAFLLTEPKKQGSAQVLPIGLPCAAYATDRGKFQTDGDELVLIQTAIGRRAWLPLLVSWDSARNRKDVHWRILTVSEQSRIVGPDKAFAARVSWGRHETYVIYRSLGAPATRAFLGHHTRARFLVGLFTSDGTVEPILEIN
jgi:hypothetical protein